LGWGHGDEEIFTREQLVQWFDLPGISAAPSRFNADKLRWVNQEHMKRLPEAELGKRLVPFLVRAGLDPATGPDAGAVATLLRDRADTLVAMADAAHYFYAAPHVAPEKLSEQVTATNRPALLELHAEFATIPWTREALMPALKAAATRHGLKPPPVMMGMRMLVAGTTSTPAIDAVLALLGRDATRARMAGGLSLV
jgi:glutamyl-tRNA synthetase